MANKPHYLELDKSAMGELSQFMHRMALKKKWRARRRASAVYSSYKYRMAGQIAQELGCSVVSVYDWLKRYKQHGLAGIADKTPPTKLTPQQVDEIMKISGWSSAYRSGKDRQKAWSFRRITQWIKDNWNITISYERVRQMVHKKLSE